MAFHFNVASAEVLQASFCGMDITPCKLPPTPGCPAPPPKPATVVPPTPPPLFGPTSSSFFTPGAVSGRQKKIPKKPEGQPLEDEFPNLTIHVTSAPSNTSAFPPPPSFTSGLSAPTFHAGAKEGNPRASPRRARKAPEKHQHQHQHHAQPHASIDPYPAPKPPIFSATPPRPPPKPATISFTESELKRLVNSVSAAARAATRAEFFALAAEKSAASASAAFSSMKPPSLSSSFANFSFGTNNEVPVTFHFGSPPPPPNKPNRGPDPSSYWNPNPYPPPPAATTSSSSSMPATDNFSAPKFSSNPTASTTTGTFASFASIPTPAPSFAPPPKFEKSAPSHFTFPPPPVDTKMPSNAGVPPNIPGAASGFPGGSPPPPPRPSNSQYTFVPAPPPRRDSCTSSSSSSAAAAAAAAAVAAAAAATAAAAASSSSSSSFDFSTFSASSHSKPPVHPTFTPNSNANSTNNPTNPTSAETTHGASFESPLPSPRMGGMESPNRRVYRARRSEAGTGRGVADDKENDKPPRGAKPAGGSAARKKLSPRNSSTKAKPSPSPRHTPEPSEQEEEPPVFRRQSSAYSSCASSTTNPSTDPNGLENWTVKQLIRELTKFGVATEECLEKSELILKVRQCYMQTFEQRKAAQSKQKAAETAEKVAKDAERAKEKVVLEVAAWAKKKNILQMLNDVSGKKPNEAGYLRNTDPLETVVKAYKKALLVIHPDKHMGDEIGHIRATERFKYVHEAMESHKASMEKKQYFYSAQYGFKAGGGGVPRQRASAGSSQFW